MSASTAPHEAHNLPTNNSTTSTLARDQATKSSALSMNGDQETVSADLSQKNLNPKSDQDTEYPPTQKALVVMMAIMLASFLVSLDRTIVATAIPAITNEFKSLNDVGWYASAYFLTMSSFQMVLGRFYTFYSVKHVFLCCIGLFEVGSVVCGAAPNSPTLILGRAIAGMGASGLFSGAITIMVHTLPLAKRPAYMGVFGAVFAIASTAGPLLGGVFTSKVSWRWCFYINLPFGGLAFLAILMVLRLPQKTSTEQLSWKGKLLRLDLLGNLFLIPAIVCLLLALQWGGTTYNWSEWRIVLLFVFFVILLLAFILVQITMPDTATIPFRILKNRSVLAVTFYIFVASGGFVISVYFIPIWFQAIKGVTPVKSGIMNLPLLLSLAMTALLVGFVTKKTGLYAPWMLLSTVMMPIGAGLITTFKVDTGHAEWIGYQVIIGVGIGMGMQQPNLAIQTVLPRRDVPTGASLVFFCNGMGGAIFGSVANNIFDNKLKQGLQSIQDIDANLVTNVGVTDLRHVVTAQQLPSVLLAYNAAWVSTFYIAVALVTTAIIGAIAVEWKSTKASEAQKKNTSGLHATAEKHGDEKV